MERTMLSWNLANWITVMLMAAGGYVVLALIAQVFLKPGQSLGSGGGGY
jgi:hypothetical protein